MTTKKIKIRRKYQNSPKIRGIYSFSVLDCATDESKKMCDNIKELKKAGKEYAAEMKNFMSKFLVGTLEFHNLVPDVGLQVIAENIANPSPAAEYNPNISYIGVGTGTNSAAAGDTTLQTEVFRDAVDTWSRSDQTAKNAILIGYSEANGNTLSEVAAFAGSASATADTGKLMSRANLTTVIVKDSSRAVFVEISHTLANG